MREKDTFIKRFLSRLFNEDINISNQLSNLIMLCTAIGCLFALFASLLLNQSISVSIMVTIALAVVCFCLYLSAWCHKPRIASILVILLIDEVIFPFMFFVSGGIHSGMICWLIVGLIFPFLVLDGKTCTVIVCLSMITLSGLFFIEYFGLVTSDALSGFGWVEDAVQSMILVSLIFGVIFKFQAKIYTRQADKLKKLNEEFDKANKAKSVFLANMSHEIRTPINAIVGFSEIITRESTEDSVVQNTLKIQDASNNLLSIINDILDFSKIESGKIELFPEKYHLSSLLSDCYSMVAMRAANKGLNFTITNNPFIPDKLLGDEIRIRQIVINLLTNAIKYTKTGSVELNVDFEVIDDTNINLICAVKDTGVGISKEDLDKLYVSFQRIDEKHNRTIEGTGLGLTISKRLIDEMGGTITVESEPGKGSVFTVSIPQVVKGQSTIGDFEKRYKDISHRATPVYKKQFTAPSARILIVDDVKMNLDVARGLLKATQIQLDTSLSGMDALSKTAAIKYDLIFLDHMMPELDGIETLHRLKAENKINASTPVVALTANAIKGVEEMYLSEGFDGYLSKPVHGEDLEKMIVTHIPESKILVAEETSEDTDTGEMSLDKRFPFLDTQMGMSYCADMEEVYLEVLQSYLESDLSDELICEYEKQDWQNYCVHAHAVKSTSLTIGEPELSALAKEMEFASREGNTDLIQEKHEEFIGSYKELLDKLKKAL